jgi:hypothetical protein
MYLAAAGFQGGDAPLAKGKFGCFLSGTHTPLQSGSLARAAQSREVGFGLVMGGLF